MSDERKPCGCGSVGKPADKQSDDIKRSGGFNYVNRERCTGNADNTGTGGKRHSAGERSG